MGRSLRADRGHAGIAAMIAAHKRAGLSCGGAPLQTTAYPVNGASQTAGSSHAKSLYSQSVLSPNEDSPKYFTKMTFASSSPLTPARQNDPA
jgi:hypothetical protein